MNEWTLCSEEHPPKSGQYMFYDEEGYVTMGDYQGREYYQRWGVPVVAWMPLPEPPPDQWLANYFLKKREADE